MDIPPVFSSNLSMSVFVTNQPDPVEEQHLQRLQRHIQPLQRDRLLPSPQSQQNQQQKMNAGVVVSQSLSSTRLTSQPESFLQPQTPEESVQAATFIVRDNAIPTNTTLSAIFPSTPSVQMTPVTPSPSSLGIIPEVHNIVSTVNLGCTLDLNKIVLHARNAEYNPKRFSAVIMKIREPRTTALIFSSGKLVCTGAKTEEQSRLAARKYARIVQKIGFEAKFLNFKIQNMLASCDVKFPIRLEGLFLNHSKFSSYEPELFPGLTYRMMKPRIVLLIFDSGKVTFSGAKVRSQIDAAFENIYPILKRFQKK